MSKIKETYMLCPCGKVWFVPAKAVPSPHCPECVKAGKGPRRRRCLRCLEWFSSAHAINRICALCELLEERARREEAGPVEDYRTQVQPGRPDLEVVDEAIRGGM